MLDRIQQKITLDGTSGSDVEPTGGPVKLLMVGLDYTGLAATSDVTVSDASGAAGTVLTVRDSNTDAVRYPRALASRSDGSASALTEVPPIVDGLKVEIAEGTDRGVLVVHAVVER